MKEKTLDFLSQTPSILLGTAYAILDNVPYAFLLTPHWMISHFASVGIVMVMVATIFSQAVFALTSQFPYAVGVCNVENVPFLYAISSSVLRELASSWGSDLRVLADDPSFIAAATSNIVFAFTISTAMTGIAFYALARLGVMNDLTSFVPPSVFRGCIGGMGIFICFASFEVATNKEISIQDFNTIMSLWSPILVFKMAIPVIFELLVRLGSKKVDSIFFTPLFMLSVPFIFYIILFASGLGLNRARESGWLFDLKTEDKFGELTYQEPTIDPRKMLKNINVWSSVDLRHIQPNVLVPSALTIVYLVLFSLIHVPLNVPLLARSEEYQIDIDAELRYHAYSHGIVAILGGLQSYMTYATSVLMKMSGLRTRGCNFCIPVLTLFCISIGPTAFINCFPRPCAALFLLHVGFVLVKDGVLGTYKTSSTFDFTITLMISLLMQYDFVQGLGLGFVMCLLDVVFNIANVDIVHSISQGKISPVSDKENLDIEPVPFTVVALRGPLFFGNSLKLRKIVEPYLVQEMRTGIVILDFSHVLQISSASFEALTILKDISLSLGPTLVITGISTTLQTAWDSWVKRCRTCEGNFTELLVASSPLQVIETIRHSQTLTADSKIYKELANLLPLQKKKISSHPLGLDRPLLPYELLNHTDQIISKVFPELDRMDISRLLLFSQVIYVKKGQRLWCAGDFLDFFGIVESGTFLSNSSSLQTGTGRILQFADSQAYNRSPLAGAASRKKKNWKNRSLQDYEASSLETYAARSRTKSDLTLPNMGKFRVFVRSEADILGSKSFFSKFATTDNCEACSDAKVRIFYRQEFNNMATEHPQIVHKILNSILKSSLLVLD